MMSKSQSCWVRRITTSLIALALLLWLVPEPAQAQWPPFTFRLTPTHADGQITYQILFRVPRRVEWAMTNVRINIPLPEGTRFVKADVSPPTEVSFNGAEISFFSSVLDNRNINNGSFTVEVVDATKTVYSTNAWISWEGDQAGTFLSRDYSVNTARISLDWEEPPGTRLLLKTYITTQDNLITYYIYPYKGSLRMWDVRISLPFPPGTTLVSAEAPPPFVVGSNEGEVAFTVVELERQADPAPLIVRLSAQDPSVPAVTQLWASWKNAGRRVGLTIPAEEALKSGDIAVWPQGQQTIVVDITGEVPFSHYDLAAISLQEVLLPAGQGPALKTVLSGVENLGGIDLPLVYYMYFDTDCQRATGYRTRYLGAEYRVDYNHNNCRARIRTWEPESETWVGGTYFPVSAPATGNSVTLWIPSQLLQAQGQVCWLASSRYITSQYATAPPRDYLPGDTNADYKLIRYQFSDQISTVDNSAPPPYSRPSSQNQVKTRDESDESAIVGDIIIPDNAQWRFLPGWANPGEDWFDLTFDDMAWFIGTTKIGYNDKRLNTDLTLLDPNTYAGKIPRLVYYHNPDTGIVIAVPPSGMERTLYLRHTFAMSDLTNLEDLTLFLNFKDGFVAYLNGVEVGRRNLGRTGDPVRYDTYATQANKTRLATPLDLNQFIPLLHEDKNVLAIEVHRYSRGEEALSLGAMLVDVKEASTATTE